MEVTGGLDFDLYSSEMGRHWRFEQKRNII